MSINFRFSLKGEGNNPCLSICEDQTPAEAMNRLVAVEFRYGSRVTKVTDTLLVLRQKYMGRDEIAVFQGSTDEMKKLVAMATLYPQVKAAYQQTEEHIEEMTEAVEGVLSMIQSGVPQELALLMPSVKSESGGRLVIKKTLLHVFGASEEEMKRCLESEEMRYEEILLLCEMVEGGIFSSFTEALAYAKAS